MSYDPDEMMLELFRAEVESHSDSLSNSLLKLEQDPEATNVLDGMMRAAHSIKGAAKIVRVDAAVDVAHVMEDCFVSAQRGELVLESSSIDVLLHSVDLLVQISEASKDPNVDWARFAPTLKAAVQQLKCVLNKQPLDSSLPLTSAVLVPSPAPPPSVKAPFAPTVPESPTPPKLVLPDSLDIGNAEELRVQLIDLLQLNARVTLDFGCLKDMDAVGLAWLHSATKYAKINEFQLTAANPSPSICPALELVGLTIAKDA